VLRGVVERREHLKIDLARVRMQQGIDESRRLEGLASGVERGPEVVRGGQVRLDDVL
jgi:hypothetical protein